MGNEIKTEYKRRKRNLERVRRKAPQPEYRIKSQDKRAEIVLITSFPPRECGIATFSKDLLKSLKVQFGNTFKFTVCPLETNNDKYSYSSAVKYKINTDRESDFERVAHLLNANQKISLVLVQHEFGLVKNNGQAFLNLLKSLKKPVAITYHTVLSKPEPYIKETIQRLSSICQSVIVMTQNSVDILVFDYDIPKQKITVIPHGTHLVDYVDKDELKEKYGLVGKKVLTTFGLLGPGKSIETTLNALPGIVKNFPHAIFLILGRTHPALVKEKGEEYREYLQDKVSALGLRKHVVFVNKFLPIQELLEYLQLTDIYLFTSKDPKQAVSGTFVYAMSCGCPIVSTPIPHATEVLQNKAGAVFNFMDSKQLADIVVKLLADGKLLKSMRLNGLHTMARSSWANAAIAHAYLFEDYSSRKEIKFTMPSISLKHLKNMTTEVGIIQFCKINQPDITSGYTLDDNARALILVCRNYELTRDTENLEYIKIYFRFLLNCFRPNGRFLNYVDGNCQFTEQNYIDSLEDANGRAIWALGYLITIAKDFPASFQWIYQQAKVFIKDTLTNIERIQSPRAMAFIVMGLYYVNNTEIMSRDRSFIIDLTKEFADRLMDNYRRESGPDWAWFESYLTYGNSVIPHGLLLAYMITLDKDYKEIAKKSFDFLLSKVFIDGTIRVISNKSWLTKEDEFSNNFIGGEQPIDVGTTILALQHFNRVFPNEGYDTKMEIAFSWFLGNNPLRQTVYNPCTGGCYDGVEKHTVNLNQGAESTIMYLLSRLAMEENLKI